MTTPNTLPANGGVSDAEVRAAVYASLGMKDHGGHLTSNELVKMRRALEAFAQSRQPSAQGGERVDRDDLIERVDAMLGDVYHCTRVWAAWQVGTMSEHDFEEARGSSLAGEIVDEILANTPPAGGGKEALSADIDAAIRAGKKG